MSDLGTLASAPAVPAQPPRSREDLDAAKQLRSRGKALAAGKTKQKRAGGAGAETADEAAKKPREKKGAKKKRAAAKDDEVVLARAELEAAIASEELQLRQMLQRKAERDALTADLASAKATLGQHAMSELDAAVARIDALADAMETADAEGVATPAGREAAPAARGQQLRTAMEAMRQQLAWRAEGGAKPKAAPERPSLVPVHGRRAFVDPHADLADDKPAPEAAVEPGPSSDAGDAPDWLDDDFGASEAAQATAGLEAPSLDLPDASETLAIVSDVLSALHRRAAEAEALLAEAAADAPEAEDASYSDDEFEAEVEVEAENDGDAASPVAAVDPAL